MDEHKMMGKALKETKIPYFRDSDLFTPLDNAFQFQSQETMFEILK